MVNQYAHMTVLFALLGALSYFDIRERRLPNRLVLAVALLGLLLCLAECVQTGHLLPLGTALLGALATAGPAAIAAGFYYLLRRKEGFGAGDLKLLAALGLYFGPVGFWILPVAAMAALLVTIPRLAFSKLGTENKETVRKHTLAFGPYIALASIILALLN